MTGYWITLGVGVCLCWLLFFMRTGEDKRVCLLSLPLALALGAALAKVGYVLLMAQRQLLRYGVEAFVMWSRAEHFSVLCGAAGVVAGVALSAKICGKKALPALDVFAPGGALLLAAVRLAEYWQGTLGVSRYQVETASALAHFPFAVPNRYGEYFGAVFMLEMLLALACAAGILLWRNRPAWRKPGVTFEVTAFYLALPQVFCESLRANCMKWGFVRVEQALCGLLMLLLIALACRRTRKGGFWRRFWPCFGHLACVLLVVWVELALDKWSSWPDWANYLLMLAALGGMAFCEMTALGALGATAEKQPS